MVCCWLLLQAGTESAQAPQLYTVLEQRKASVGAGLMGTDHVYVLPGQEGAAGKRRYVNNAGPTSPASAICTSNSHMLLLKCRGLHHAPLDCMSVVALCVVGAP